MSAGDIGSDIGVAYCGTWTTWRRVQLYGTDVYLTTCGASRYAVARRGGTWFVIGDINEATDLYSGIAYSTLDYACKHAMRLTWLLRDMAIARTERRVFGDEA